MDKGARNVEILKQGQNSPMRVEEQVAIIYLGSKGLLGKVPVKPRSAVRGRVPHHDAQLAQRHPRRR
jgi:F-type H+-transporting ATPase subunit alpha